MGAVYFFSFVAAFCFGMAAFLYYQPRYQQHQNKRRAEKEREKRERSELLAALRDIRERPTTVQHNTQNNYETNNYLVQNIQKKDET